jgi:hypothetical protein
MQDASVGIRLYDGQRWIKVQASGKFVSAIAGSQLLMDVFGQAINEGKLYVSTEEEVSWLIHALAEYNVVVHPNALSHYVGQRYQVMGFDVKVGKEFIPNLSTREMMVLNTASFEEELTLAHQRAVERKKVFESQRREISNTQSHMFRLLCENASRYANEAFELAEKTFDQMISAHLDHSHFFEGAPFVGTTNVALAPHLLTSEGLDVLIRAGMKETKRGFSDLALKGVRIAGSYDDGFTFTFDTDEGEQSVTLPNEVFPTGDVARKEAVKEPDDIGESAIADRQMARRYYGKGQSIASRYSKGGFTAHSSSSPLEMLFLLSEIRTPDAESIYTQAMILLGVFIIGAPVVSSARASSRAAVSSWAMGGTDGTSSFMRMRLFQDKRYVEDDSVYASPARSVSSYMEEQLAKQRAEVESAIQRQRKEGADDAIVPETATLGVVFKSNHVNILHPNAFLSSAQMLGSVVSAVDRYFFDLDPGMRKFEFEYLSAFLVGGWNWMTAHKSKHKLFAQYLCAVEGLHPTVLEFDMHQDPIVHKIGWEYCEDASQLFSLEFSDPGLKDLFASVAETPELIKISERMRAMMDSSPREDTPSANAERLHRLNKFSRFLMLLRRVCIAGIPQSPIVDMYTYATEEISVLGGASRPSEQAIADVKQSFDDLAVLPRRHQDRLTSIKSTSAGKGYAVRVRPKGKVVTLYKDAERKHTAEINRMDIKSKVAVSATLTAEEMLDTASFATLFSPASTGSRRVPDNVKPRIVYPASRPVLYAQSAVTAGMRRVENARKHVFLNKADTGNVFSKVARAMTWAIKVQKKKGIFVAADYPSWDNHQRVGPRALLASLRGRRDIDGVEELITYLERMTDAGLFVLSEGDSDTFPLFVDSSTSGELWTTDLNSWLNAFMHSKLDEVPLYDFRLEDENYEVFGDDALSFWSFTRPSSSKPRDMTALFNRVVEVPRSYGYETSAERGDTNLSEKNAVILNFNVYGLVSRRNRSLFDEKLKEKSLVEDVTNRAGFCVSGHSDDGVEDSYIRSMASFRGLTGEGFASTIGLGNYVNPKLGREHVPPFAAVRSSTSWAVFAGYPLKLLPETEKVKVDAHEVGSQPSIENASVTVVAAGVPTYGEVTVEDKQSISKGTLEGAIKRGHTFLVDPGRVVPRPRLYDGPGYVDSFGEGLKTAIGNALITSDILRGRLARLQSETTEIIHNPTRLDRTFELERGWKVRLSEPYFELWSDGQGNISVISSEGEVDRWKVHSLSISSSDSFAVAQGICGLTSDPPDTLFERSGTYFSLDVKTGDQVESILKDYARDVRKLREADPAILPVTRDDEKNLLMFLGYHDEEAEKFLNQRALIADLFGTRRVESFAGDRVPEMPLSNAHFRPLIERNLVNEDTTAPLIKAAASAALSATINDIVYQARLAKMNYTHLFDGVHRFVGRMFLSDLIFTAPEA